MAQNISYNEHDAGAQAKTEIQKKTFLADTHVFIYFASIVLIATLSYGVVHWYQNNKAGLPFYGDNGKINSANAHFIVPQFSFTNQDGQTITSSFIKNKIWVADYFFTSCGSSCPKLTKSLKTIQTEFKSDDNVRLLSFSVDPQHDTPQRLTSYAKQFDATIGQWQFLTGEKTELYRFARNGLFITAAMGDGGENDFIHSSSLVLMDKDGHIRGYYDGTSNGDVRQLIKDIKRLEKNN